MPAHQQSDLNALSRNMRAALASSGLSINQAARAAGVSQPAMSNYLAGRRCPDALTLSRFAAFTKTTVEAILVGTTSTTCK